MHELFSEHDFRSAYPPGIEHHFWHRTRHDALARLLFANLASDARIMDVGCGLGITTAYLRSRGLDCSGVELGPAPLNDTRRAYIKTNQDLFALEQSELDSIDCVLLLDVLEHMSEREAFLATIFQRLPNCRKILITVPARRELWSKYDTDWRHILRYDRRQLRQEIESAQFKVTYMAYYFQSAYLAALGAKTLGLTRSSEFKSPDRSLATRIAHTVLTTLGLIENRLLPAWVPGSSLICIAQRPDAQQS